MPRLHPPTRIVKARRNRRSQFKVIALDPKKPEEKTRVRVSRLPGRSATTSTYRAISKRLTLSNFGLGSAG